jgi:hypothetical protein
MTQASAHDDHGSRSVEQPIARTRLALATSNEPGQIGRLPLRLDHASDAQLVAAADQATLRWLCLVFGLEQG